MSQYRIGVLLYFRSIDNRLLLIRRKKAPNAGLWCAVGGKLEMESGESPVECARREAREEIGIDIEDGDLSLRCMLSEKNYDGTGHWLMFVYEIKKRLSALPPSIGEGEFEFFDIDTLEGLDMPLLDKSILVDRLLDKNGAQFYSIHVKDGMEKDPSSMILEESIGA